MKPMQWENLLSPKRYIVKDEYGSKRSPFLKDYDRILFSSSFRRLGKKTQVHPLTFNDHIHSRLTHSLEVSSVGRDLGFLCGKQILKEKFHNDPKLFDPTIVSYIVQAACLAHDIGNTPFGHAGEKAIGSWFCREGDFLLEYLKEDERDDLRHFEGNAQGFRILTKHEQNILEMGGLNLTYATLAATLKYPWTSRYRRNKHDKFNVFQSEIAIFEEIVKEVKLIKKDTDCYCRHPLAFLVEAADDICNRILDLEDAMEMKLIPFLEIWELLSDLCKNDPDYPNVKKSVDLYIKNVEKRGNNHKADDNKQDFQTPSFRHEMNFLRAKSIGTAVKDVVKAFMDNYDAIMFGDFETTPLIDKCSNDVKRILGENGDAHTVIKTKVFLERHKLEIEIGCYSTIGVLLDAFSKAITERFMTDKTVSFKSERVLKLMELKVNTVDQVDTADPNTPVCKKQPAEPLLYDELLLGTDYISGMTDNYAIFMARQISGTGI